ncbi:MULTISPECIES: branched-chain amino acid ABC transporter permease [unclassified Diaminobutyricimonas]|uniref:branched-chain amino acid ABC transporter permease n=1 Tax=unclassified Diaminobutyricimonas TaxID=2643261 RepID=UPI0012F48DD1|nr:MULTISPECIES: branched-chain amino acid ABC transporter permease [unclassified Diaminobutyricimonas]
MHQVLQTIISGLLLGGLYATFALGFSLTWGLLRTINFAHFGFAFLSAYLTYEFSAKMAVDPLLTLLITVPLGVLLAVGLQWFVAKTRMGVFGTLIATFGLLLVIEAGIAFYWTQDLVRIPASANPWAQAVIWLGGFTIPSVQLFGLIAAILFCGSAWWLLNRSRYGFAIRAGVQDPSMAAAFGINAPRLGYVIAVISGAAVAVAGSLIGTMNALSPSAALAWVPITLAIVLLGGLANPVGVSVAALVLALVESFTRQFASPSLAQLVALAVLVLVILFRPNGMFRPTVAVSGS